MPDRWPIKAHAHPMHDTRDVGPGGVRTPYAELSVTSNFTFLRGGSHPEELVERAHELGHAGVGITDTNSLAGIVRAHVVAKRVGIPLAVGCRIEVSDGPAVLVYPTDRASYSGLCRLLTLGKRRAPKGECHLTMDDLCAHASGLLAIVETPSEINGVFARALHDLRDAFDGDRLSIEASWLYRGDDSERMSRIAELGLPMVATNRVLYHTPERRLLQDVVTCVRHGCTVEQAGLRLVSNAERHLKPHDEMARLFAEYPAAIERSVEIAQRASAFSLDELRYEYPDEVCPQGMSAFEYLERCVWDGARVRYGDEVPEKTRTSIAYELALIKELKYEAYFLTCHDIINFARGRGILCQGRGGAANSAVCYCLGITEVDPAQFSLLFERFISRERNEPPDIDIDFEHERREEVIQYLYRKYGRERAALTAEVISYRGRSAIREVAKAMGLSADSVDALAKNLDRWGDAASDDRVREVGLEPSDPTIRRVIELSQELVGFPRHLSQHVGGFVITRGYLCDLVPIENASMEDRTVIEWDKDDIDAMGMLKVDCLGLGMLTCVRRALEMVITATQGRSDAATKEFTNGDGADVPGLDRVAEGDGTREVGLSRIAGDADRGAVRADKSDETGCGFRAIQHCRRSCEAEPRGLHPVSAQRAGLAGGVDDSSRVGGFARDADAVAHLQRDVAGDRPGFAGADPFAGEEAGLKPSSLHRSVAPSLTYDLFASIASSPTDPVVYDMICAADTIGVFQIESRAQMSMLPRLKPRCFYDLVIEVAIVRPGPIQGGMVHPYLRRREGKEAVEYPSDDVREVLERTLGVPLFQEQAMQLAIVAAGFTPDEADGLRRSMAAWKRKGNAIYEYGMRLVEGMLRNGYERDFAERCFEQIKGFSEYGFPESHAASFAILVYVSCWLKRHEPAAFAAALINSQPMGFYQPAQIIRDAREHGVEVRPVDVNESAWDCSLEETDGETERRSDAANAKPDSWGVGGPAIRLGMRMVKGMPEAEARAIADAVRARGRFETIESLWRASGVSVKSLRALAKADAFNSMGLDRRRALWQVRPLRDIEMPLFDGMDSTDERGLDALPRVEESDRVLHDYSSVGLSLRAHPVSLIRDDLRARRVIEAGDLRSAKACAQGTRVRVAGLVLCRQRPGTASGVVFLTLEDETGIANLIVWPDTFERYRRVARLSGVLLADGIVEREGPVVHVHVRRLERLDGMLPKLSAISRDFH